MSLKDALISAGADKLADILLSLRAKSKDVQKDLDIIIAGLDENPKKIVSAIKKEISSLKRSNKDISFKESKPLSERLDSLRNRIANDMLSKSPKMAFELMLEFLDLHEKTMERSDDSGNNIGQVFTTACKDLGNISEKAAMSQPELVNIVFKKCMENPYCIYNDIIPDFANSLTNEGRLMLKDKFENIVKSGDEWTRSKARNGLLSVADLMKDVDAYINACSNTGEPYNQFRENAYIKEISSRLIQHGRGQEALVWLDRDKTNTTSAYFKLRVQAYESIEDHDKAQNERLIWFDKNLDADAYLDILNAASTDFKTAFKTKAIKKALSHPEPQIALLFLMQVKESEGIKKFIRLRHGSLDGRDYRLLRSVIELVQNTDPVAATLIYRTLINGIIDAGKSNYYKYAAKDLVQCSILNEKITDWESFEDHTEYLGCLQDIHKAKRSFWSEYEYSLTLPTPAKKRKKM